MRKMYQEQEQDENVARGCIKVTELIAYHAEGKAEAKSKTYFCQTKEQEAIFAANNPDARIETFEIQLLKSTAIRFIDDPENIDQFKEQIL